FDYESVPVNLLKSEHRSEGYKALYPGQAMPTMVLEDGTVLTQSLAILEYLDALVPKPRLIPIAPLDRARVLTAAHTFALDVHPVNNLRVVKFLKSKHGLSDDNVRDWMLHWMAEGCSALEAQIDDHTTFCFGETPDIADLCLVAQLYNAKRWGFDMTPYPKLNRVDAACLALPAIAAAHPDKQPDASPQ
ncbi:MAG: maleylacetoacetate isomerase, partial [Pseudomonadota bacterium]